MKKRKADCTPEEWAAIRERARAYDAKQRLKPQRQEYMRRYLKEYCSTAEYKQRDNARYGDARRTRCRERFRFRTYGVTPDDVERASALQNGRCAICQRKFGDIPSRRHGAECVDHCHDSGLFRGLLCRMCNTTEGFIRGLGLTPEQFAQRMRDYLDSPPAQEEQLW